MALQNDQTLAAEKLRCFGRLKRWLLNHPRGVFFATLLVLFMLDVGRSLYARWGYRQPSQAFSGAPFDQNYPWPPGSGIEANATRGKKLYGRFCSACHGLTGNGLGPAAGNMTPRPRDFRLASFKYQTTFPDQAPSDQDIEQIIGRGLRASAMPAFADLMSPSEIHEVAEHLKTFAKERYEKPRDTRPIPAEPLSTPERIEDGRQLYEQNCRNCHGKDGQGIGTQRTLQSWGPRDLTAPWSFRATETTADIWLRITQGINLGGMPAAKQLSDDERWKVAQYVKTLAKPAPWQPGGKLTGLGMQNNMKQRGEYLLHSLTCTYCHTESVVPMNYNPDRFLAGGSATRTYPDGTVVNPNITSDIETGIGRWTEQDIVRALTQGRTPTRSLDLSFKQWFFFQFEPQDAAALAHAVSSVPPKRQRTPPPLRYGVLETCLAKLARLPMITPTQLKIPVPTGPFVQNPPRWLPYDWPQQLLRFLQGTTLVTSFSVLLLVAIWRRKHGFPVWTRRTLRYVWGTSFCAAFLLLFDQMYVFIPRQPMTRFMQESLWQPPNPDPFVMRGRYLYSVSCMFCHQVDGAGGDRLSDPYAGGFSIRNITSHKTHGIGNFSDDEIARVLRSGLSKDGQQIFWGFMPWDMFSNLDETDIRALIAYLRTFPSVEKPAAPREPPRQDHPPEITWTIDMSRIVSRILALIPFVGKMQSGH